MADISGKTFLQKLRNGLLFLVSAILVTGGVVSFFMYNYGNTPAGSVKDTKIIEVQPGMSLKQVSRTLANQQILHKPDTFVWYTRLQGKQNDIKAGEYRFSQNMPPWKILDALCQGMTVLYSVTIPEGFRISEIAALMEEKGLATQAEFIEATRNPSLLESLKIPTSNLEGYLYPDTYRFSKTAGAGQIVQTLLNTFKDRVQTPELKQRMESQKLSLHEIVTLASLIEKETGLAKERRLISSVFHNRLVKKMRLQTDPTVIYAMVNFDGNIRKKDLSIDSPYNTYKYAGLPPGPIASPGLESIVAAMDPAESEFLYFVSRKNGSHQFSTNYKDHTRAVQKYQLGHRSRG